MSYFTETFESILEANKTSFDQRRNLQKHSALSDYEHTKRRMKEKGMHTYSHKFDMTAAGTDKDIAERKKYNRLDTAMRAQDAKERHARRHPNNESFDPVYEDLCRMGVID